MQQCNKVATQFIVLVFQLFYSFEILQNKILGDALEWTLTHLSHTPLKSSVSNHKLLKEGKKHSTTLTALGLKFEKSTLEPKANF